jgi:hypothetical protein
MADDGTKSDNNLRQTVAEEAEAAYFARRYGLAADELSDRAKLEAAARRLVD